MKSSCASDSLRRRNLLYRVSPRDPLAAYFLPAWCATQIDPVQARGVERLTNRHQFDDPNVV
jgi:hypothetical protein